MKKIQKILFTLCVFTLFAFVVLFGIQKIFLTFDYDVKYNYISNIENIDKDIFITLHGIYGETKDLEVITNNLIKNKSSVINIQYPTVYDDITTIEKKYITSVILEEDKKLTNINNIRKKENKPELKLNFVVHSMGSIVLRKFLKDNKIQNLGKVIFISPPSNGSGLANHKISALLKPLLGKAVFDLKTGNNTFISTLGEPDYECYILIGDKSNNFLYSFLIPGRDDGMVPLDTAKLNNCNIKTIKNTTHTSILTNKETIFEVINYFNN